MNRIKRLSESPEANVIFFSFLLNFVWEMWQVPFYKSLPTMDHMDAVRICTQASIGDALISLLSFWAAAGVIQSRRWFLSLTPLSVLIYWAMGVAITIVLEWLATGPLDRWQYSAAMPRIPALGTGLLPLLQWTLLPAVVLFLVKRQAPGTERSSR